MFEFIGAFIVVGIVVLLIIGLTKLADRMMTLQDTVQRLEEQLAEQKTWTDTYRSFLKIHRPWRDDVERRLDGLEKHIR